MNEDSVTEKFFLQIKSIRTSSNAFVMKLKEDDIIIAIDGEVINKSYEDLSKELVEIKEKKVITLLRDEIFFNTFVYGPLGVICENITTNQKPELKSLNINELCAGTGEMMYQINKSISSFKQFKQSCNFYILEISPELIKIQKKRNSLFKIKWIDNLNEIKKNPSIFLANEFFDSLPVKHFIRENNEWFEKYVTKKKDKYFFKNKKKKIVEIEEILGEKIKKNQNFIEVSPKSIAKISKISSIIKKNNGGILIIDYGYLEKKMSDTIQCVKNHKKVDFLNNIYDSDITHLLNFKFYLKKLKKNLDKVKITTQGEFLTNMGIFKRAEMISKSLSFSKKSDLYYRLQRLVDDKQMGKLFKVMFATKKKNKFSMGFK